MPNNPMHLEEVHTLEMLIDRYGLPQVLHEIQQITDMKAEHIQGNWNDQPLAMRWRWAGKYIAHAIERIRKVMEE